MKPAGEISARPAIRLESAAKAAAAPKELPTNTTRSASIAPKTSARIRPYQVNRGAAWPARIAESGLTWQVDHGRRPAQ
jgi:hypothetical protein